MEEKFVKISVKELSGLLSDHYELVALECAGVDNWSFYGDHRRYYLEDCPEKSWSELIENGASEEAILDAYELVKHGEWIECSNELNKYCSVCKKIHGIIYEKPSFCENCGAEMNKSKTE